MPRREEAQFPQPESQQSKYSSKHFANEQADRKVFANFTFEFCTFEKMGFRNTEFTQCVFRHCDFIGCYLLGGKYNQCDFTGTYFEHCNFTRAQFPHTRIDYARFERCAPVFEQITEIRPSTPQAAAKLFRNLAVEHKNLGNWQQVDRLLIEGSKERQRHYRYVFTGHNDYYRTEYNQRRFWYFVRYVISVVSGLVWGYGISGRAFFRSLCLTGFIILPIVNAVFGKMTTGTTIHASTSTVSDALGYLGALYKATAQAFLPFIPSNLSVTPIPYSLPFGITVIESLLGTIFLALFVSLLFRASSKGAL